MIRPLSKKMINLQALTDQNCFKTFIFHEPNVVTIELIDSEISQEWKDSNEENDDPEWHAYVQEFCEVIFPPLRCWH